MTSFSDRDFDLEVSRRRLLAAAGVAGALGLAPLAGARAAQAAADRRSGADPTVTPPVAGLHLQFGADAAAQVTVSWHTLQPVHDARVIVGRMDGHFEQTVPARTVSYTDAKANQVVYAHHARIERLAPDSSYLYGARCTTAPSPSSAPSAPRRAAAPASPSPASATRARPRWASASCRPPA